MDDLVAEFGQPQRRPLHRSNLQNQTPSSVPIQSPKRSQLKVVAARRRQILSPQASEALASPASPDESNKLKSDRAQIHGRHAAPHAVSVWQNEADEEEWSAWIDGCSADRHIPNEDEAEWETCAIPRAMSPSTGYEQRRRIDVVDISPSGWTHATESDSRPSSRPEFRPGGTNGSLNLFSLQDRENNAFLNPWHDSVAPAIPMQFHLESQELRIETPEESSETPSPWLEVANPADPEISGNIHDDVRFNPWNGGDHEMNGEEDISTKQLRHDLKITNSHVHPEALSRDETQRRLVIQHCIRSGLVLKRDSSRVMLPNYATWNLLAWIHKLLDGMKARPKTD